MFVAIAEDDSVCAKQLQTYLEIYGQEQNIPMTVRIFPTGTALLDAYHPDWDLVLMDVEMPLMDGFTAARHIREKDEDLLIMFITRMAQFAINGYAVSALDYVLKPVNYFLFSTKMKRVQSLLQIRNHNGTVITVGGTTRKILLNQLYYIDIYNHTLTYHTSDGSFSVSGSKTIRQMEDELTPHGFFRCNCCYLVNLKYVLSCDNNSILLANGSKLAVSRSRRKEFMAALMDCWGG